MKRIKVLGAGRSAYYAIKYLYDNALERQWDIVVADAEQANLDLCKSQFPDIQTQKLDIFDSGMRASIVKASDVIISLLPAYFHILVARDCVATGVHLVTPSYVTADMQRLHNEAVSKKVTILNELGLDPGIDHMSSMKMIHRILHEGGKISSYKSFCGGLMAKEYADNPWQHKLTWNPYSVVRAGADGALYRDQNCFKYVPYHRLFADSTQVSAYAESFDMYLNRDATRYIGLYGLDDVPTFLRGTLRYPGFCENWNALVDAGFTSDKIEIALLETTNWGTYLKGFPFDESKNRPALDWLFEDTDDIEPKTATPAANLQKLLEYKWQMNPGDKDRVIMQHEFEYEKDGKRYLLKSMMDLIGENATKTAMAKTVGIPLAIAAGMVADGAIQTFGVILPVVSEVYEPVLAALAKEGIGFSETVQELP